MALGLEVGACVCGHGTGPHGQYRTVKASRRVWLQVKDEAKSSRDIYKVSIVWELKFLILTPNIAFMNYTPSVTYKATHKHLMIYGTRQEIVFDQGLSCSRVRLIVLTQI